MKIVNEITPRLHHALTGVQLNHCLIMHQRWKKVRFNREHLSLIFRGASHSRVWQNHGIRTTMAVLFTVWFLPARPLHNPTTCRLQKFTAKFTMIIRQKNSLVKWASQHYPMKIIRVLPSHLAECHVASRWKKMRMHLPHLEITGSSLTPI